MTSDRNLIDWYNSKDYKSINDAVGKLSASQLIELLDNHLGSANDISLLKAVLLGCDKEPLKRSLALRAAFKKGLEILGSATSKLSFHNDLVCVLNHEVANLVPESIAEIISMLLIMIQNNEVGQGQCLKIFAKLLETAQQQPTITLEKSCEVVCGADYKRDTVAEICSLAWTPETVFHLIDMFKDTPLDREEVENVLSKLFEQLPKMKNQTLPPLIYQLISLATIYRKVDAALKAILLHFNKMDSNVVSLENLSHSDQIVEADSMDSNCDSAELKSTEGTVLLYISNTLRQNQALGKGLIKVIKAAKDSPSPENITEFFLALALTISQDSRFQEESLNVLRLLVLKCFHEVHKTENSKWLLEHKQKLTDIKMLLVNLIKSCHYGWDHIISGVVDLGFNLMSHYGPKQGPFGKDFDQEIHKSDTPQQQVCDLGSHLLAKTFQLHQISRKEILSQIINMIQISIATPAYLYIDLLKAIVKSYPQLLLQSIPQIRNLLDDLPLMHEFNAKRLFSSLLPLIRISSALRTSVMLVLRKSLTSRQNSSRCIAVHGFLSILKIFPLAETTSMSQLSSQSSQSIFSTASSQGLTAASQSQGAGRRNNELLCLEVVQVLKRCLTQQCKVREQLYCGLPNVVAQNPRLAPFVICNLVKQIRLYYESVSDVIPPLKLSCCVSNSIADSCALQEPLPVLLVSTFMCLHEAIKYQRTLGDDADDDIIDEVTSLDVREMFDSMAMRMYKSEPDDYQLEKTSDYNNSDNIGQKNAAMLGTMALVYQALIDYNITLAEDLTTDIASNVLQLFQGHKKVVDLISSVKVTELSGKVWLEKQLKVVCLPNLCNLVYTLFCDESFESEAAVTMLTENDNFVRYIAVLLHDTIAHAKDKGFFLGLDCGNKRDWVSHLAKASRACLHKFMIEKNEPAKSPVTFVCLATFNSALQYVTTWQRSREAFFLAEVCGEDGDGTQAGDRVTKLIKRFQRIVMSYLAVENTPMSATHRKVLAELFCLLESLFDMALRHSPEATRQQCVEWCYKVCVEYSIDDVNASKRILQFHLHSSVTVTSRPEICARDLCFDLRMTLGSIEEDDNSEQSATYRMVTAENASHVIVAIASTCDHVIADCEWLLQHYKGRLVAHASGKSELSDDDDSLHEARRKAEGSVCGRVCTVAVGLLELAQCACQSAANVDNVLRTFTGFFTFLMALSKYYQWLYSQALGHVPSRFEKLSAFVGSKLMRPIYGFIMYAESAQTERLESVRAKQDAKKNKKKEGSAASAGVSVTSKAKVLREMKGIARLVFAIEQHEHHLILLGRKAKIDFMTSHHLPTSRDFRIRSDVLRITMAEREALAKEGQSQTSQDGERDDDSSDVENEEPTSKRPRIAS